MNLELNSTHRKIDFQMVVLFPLKFICSEHIHSLASYFVIFTCSYLDASHFWHPPILWKQSLLMAILVHSFSTRFRHDTDKNKIWRKQSKQGQLELRRWRALYAPQPAGKKLGFKWHLNCLIMYPNYQNYLY